MAPEILYPNMFKEFYYHKQFRKSIMNKRCSIQKAVLKHFAIFTRYHLCWSLSLIRFIKKKLQHRCFPVNFARFLRASFCRTFVNSCLNVFLHEKDLYRKWIRRFLKNKIRNHSKIQLDEKTCLFMFLLIPFFSISSLHVRRRLLHNSLTNEGLILDQWKN